MQVCYVRFLDIKQNGGRLRGNKPLTKGILQEVEFPHNSKYDAIIRIKWPT